MKVFISWSGDRSKHYAAALKDLLESCFHSIDVFFSEEDIPKGDNWSKTILENLSASDYCLICATKESLNSPWINFEAGAMVNNDAKVSAILFDLKNEDLKGPLSLFESTKLEEQDFERLMKNINEIEQVKSNVLEKSFKIFFKEFSEKISEISAMYFNDSTVSIEKEIKEILKIAKNSYSVLNRFESIIPSISEQVEDIKKTDFQKKYYEMLDCLFNFMFDLAAKPDEYFLNINNRFAVTQFLSLLNNIMKKDRFAKSKLSVLLEKTMNKMDKCTNKVR